jgi:hypothetical protein
MSEIPLTGGCACGAVRYQANPPVIFSGHCHCRDCQRASGAPYATVFAVPKTGFRQLQGDITRYTSTGDSGQPVTRCFCPTCGSHLYTEVTVLPDMQLIKTVSLDDPAAVAPTMHIYCDSANAWDRDGDGLPRIAKMPAPA